MKIISELFIILNKNLGKEGTLGIVSGEFKGQKNIHLGMILNTKK